MSVSTSKYLQVPYREGGREFDGCDCYGLISLFSREEQGFDLLDYKREPTALLESYCDHFDKIQIDEVQPFDFIVLSKEFEGDHCGIMIDNRHFIHMMIGCGVAVSKLSTWQRRVFGIYRRKRL